METSEHIEGTIESILFVSDKPVTLDEFKDVLESVGTAQIKEALSRLQKEYTESNRGMVIAEIAGGYQMLSSPHYALAIRRFYKTTHKEKLSKPSLETLAIIAYKQPVARIDIELIRGVNSDGVVAHLLLKGLIKIAGRKEVPGRPFIYGTTQQFLEYFGLKSLEDLPKLEEFPNLQTDLRHSEEHSDEVLRLAQDGSKDGERSRTKSPREEIPASLVGGLRSAQNDSKTLENTSGEKIRKEVETFLQQAHELSPAQDAVAFQRNAAQKPQPEEKSSHINMDFSPHKGEGTVRNNL